MSASELAQHRFDNVYMPFLLRKKGWTDTEQNRNRLMRELKNNTSTNGNRRNLDADKVPEGVYMSPGCRCKDLCYAGMCQVADRTTCSFTETFDGSYFSTWCKANKDLGDYQGTSGFKFSTEWMDCLSWNIVPCYSPEISIFYTKALQQGVYADAQSLQGFPNVGTAIPNNVDKKRNFTESGTNTPEALADVLPEGGKIRTPRRKVLTLDVRFTYVFAGDDYKAYLGQDADAAWCINEKNGASWDKNFGNCVCTGENDCEVVANDDGVTQKNGCSQFSGMSDWFGKDACKGHCRCKPKPTPEQTMATAKTTIESYMKDMHKVFGDHLQFKLSGWRTLDISTKTGTPPSGDVRAQILEKGIISLDYKALEWIMKQAKDINTDITKAPYRNPQIEVLVLPKARSGIRHTHIHAHTHWQALTSTHSSGPTPRERPSETTKTSMIHFPYPRGWPLSY